MLDDCGGPIYQYMYICYTHRTGCYMYKCLTCGHSEIDYSSGNPNYPPDPCSSCNTMGYVACPHGQRNSHTYSETCTTCNGVGTIASSPCIHGYSSSHRYCAHYTNTSLTSHQYCSHGRTSQHDD